MFPNSCMELIKAMESVGDKTEARNAPARPRRIDMY